MERRAASGLLLALTDAAAILVFVTVGLLSHDKGLSARGYARDALPLLAGWFGAALVFRPYADRRLRRLLATWAGGVTAGVVLRALVLGRSPGGEEAAFLGVALVMIGLFVLLGRLAVRLTRPRRRERRAAP